MMTITRRHVLAAPFIWTSRLKARSKATAFALIGDKPHNSDYIRTGLGRTLGRDLGLSIDFCDETKMLSAETLKGCRMLIILRDGMTWPDGYPDETSNAGWVGTGSPKIISVPPLPKSDPKPRFWMTPEQGIAVQSFVRQGGAALLLHNVTHIGLVNKQFRDVLGRRMRGIRQFVRSR
jgi:hypothetical protein